MWLLDPAAKIATVTAVLIALSPHLHKAFRLLTTSTKTSDELTEEFEFMTSGRVGWGQRLWYRFLDSCRTEDRERLSWKEWRARRWWCPLNGHSLAERYRPSDRFQGICRYCRAVLTMKTEEALEAWARRGTVPYWNREMHFREREHSVKNR